MKHPPRPISPPSRRLAALAILPFCAPLPACEDPSPSNTPTTDAGGLAALLGMAPGPLAQPSSTGSPV